MKIGFFDSGLGGLTILKAVAQVLPEYDYEYYGDTANLPYGDKTEEEIYELTKEGVEYLFERDCALVVIACNTASAQTLRQLQDTFLAEEYPDRKILGVIIPMVEEVIECHAKRAVLIATKRTVESEKYDREFAKHADRPELVSIATPQLVPLIELGEIEAAVDEVRPIIDELLARGGDSILLGCTHYTLLRQPLNERYGEAVMVFSQDEIIPKKLYQYLKAHNEIESKLSRGGTRTIHFTEHRSGYDQTVALLLGGSFIADEAK